MAYLLGIDLGTSSVKALLMDLDGNILSIKNEGYSMLCPAAGWAEQDPELWWQATARVITATVTAAGVDVAQIKGIGLSGQMHALVPLDKAGRIIRPAIIWADGRSVEECESIHKVLGETYSRITLNPVSPGFLLPSLLWMETHEPENFRQIHTVLLPKDYIRYRLTGNLGTDYSDASGSMAFDTAHMRWSEEIIHGLGLDTTLFPRCESAHCVAGQVHKAAAVECALHAGTPVVYGGGDQLMQSIGNGVVLPGIVSSNIGTASQISSPIAAAIYDEKLRTHTFCHSADGMWNLVGASLNGGICLQWFRNQFAKDKSFQDLNGMIDQVGAGSEGLIFLPYLCGERTPHLDPAARGIFFGMHFNHTACHLARSVMEGVTFALRDCLELIKGMGIHADKIIASGGGAASAQWLQIQADIFDSEIYTTNSIEQACLGAAIVAGYGVGVYKSIPEACENLVRLHPEAVAPIRENVVIYRGAYSIFQELYRRNKDLFIKIGKEVVAC